MTFETRILTPEQRAEYAVQALRLFVSRALTCSERIAEAAQRRETRVVEQYLSSLRSLRAEAEAFGWLDDTTEGND